VVGNHDQGGPGRKHYFFRRDGEKGVKRRSLNRGALLVQNEIVFFLQKAQERELGKGTQLFASEMSEGGFGGP